MLPALASVSALEAWLGYPLDGGPELAERASALLARASTLVRAETGRAWVDAEGDLVALPPEVADALELAVLQPAGRAWQNPNAAIHAVSGPFSERYAEAAADGLYLSETDKALAHSAVRAFARSEGTASTAPAGLHTVRTHRDDGELTDYRPTLTSGADPIPLLDALEPW